MRKNVILSMLVVIIAVAFIGSTFVYALKNKQVTYHPSRYVLDDVNDELATFHKKYIFDKNKPTDKVVNEAISYVSQPWITTSKDTVITKEFLHTQQKKLKELRNAFMDLNSPEMHYNFSALSSLSDIFKILEDFNQNFFERIEIENLTNEDVKYLMHNLHGGFLTFIYEIEILYEESKNL